MKKIGMKFISGFISMIMMVNLIMPMGVYASVDVTDETVIEETVDEETITQEEDLTEQLTTASGAETVEDEKETEEEETVSEDVKEEKISEPFNESKTIGDVTITVKAEAGAFPEGSYLEVKEIASNIDLSSDDETLAASYSYDITIYDKDDNEIEPAEGKNVSVSFSMDKIADSNLDTNIYHTSDDGTVTELDITTSGDTATVATDSFSVYTVVFTYDGLTYAMNGDSTIKISDILNSVGLTGDVSSVECSDTSLFSASVKSGEWVLSSHKAFSTTEWMKVSIEDVVYEIKVIDINGIVVASGTCGANLTWTLDNEGKLTISGTGAMEDYNSFTQVPWYGNRSSINSAIISNGVTSIGSNAFMGLGALSSITIPGSVTSIGASAFHGCTSLSSITIPNGVTKIFASTFQQCTGLSSITIPDSVTSIADRAFSGCSSLSSITIPGSVTEIGEYAFQYCTGLSSITIPNGVTRVASYAFDGCTSLSSITIPNSVTSIGSRAFYGCEVLSSITIPNSVTSIEGRAFNGCIGLSSIIIPASVTSIGDSAFYGCRGLSSVTIMNGVTGIGGSAFYGCTSLSSIDIPNSVTSIGNSAFAICTSLSSVTISDGVTSIENNAFNGCIGLSSITIPASVTSIGLNAFRNIKSDATIYYDGEQSTWNSMVTNAGVPSTATVKCRTDGGNCGANGDNVKWTYYDDGTLVISGTGAMANYTNASQAPWLSQRANIKNVVISDGVTSIGNRAFAFCIALTSITIPASVTSIGNSAFRNCSSLSSITIPASVTSIGAYAFDSCTSLDNITIPNSVTSIDEGAFYGCSGLSSITIPFSVTSIGNQAFVGCRNLTSITIPTRVTSIGNRAFYNCDSLTSITIPNSVTSIGSDAFNYIASNAVIDFGGTQAQWDSFGVTLATTVTVRCALLAAGNCGANGDNVKWLLKNDGTLEISGTGAMADYSSSIDVPWYRYIDGIYNVIISDGVTNIGKTAFCECTKLSSITIPNSVTSIGNGAFWECRVLSSISIPNSVTSIGNSAFNGCIGLSSITIPNGVTSIGASAFNFCESLINITIPDSVTSVGKGAFASCSNLSSLTIPASVTSIGSHAFDNCSSLSSITIPASVTSIGEGAFEYMGKNATDPTINFGGTKARWDAFGTNIKVGNNVTVNCTKFNITITAKDQSTVAGTALASDVNQVEITSGSLDTGHTLEGITLVADTSNVTTSGAITPKDAVIKSGTTAINVAENYNITYVPGKLIVTKGTPTVTAPTAKTGLVYDGTEQELLATLGSTTGGTLKYRVGDTGTFTTDKPKAKNAGDYKVYYKVDGGNNYNDDNGGSFNITIGTLPLTITADNDTKTYDGTALIKNSYTNTALAAGDSITSVTVTGSQTVYGTSNNVPSGAVIKNASNTDVTANYSITYTNGTLEITKRNVTVYVADRFVDYNANEQKGSTIYNFTNMAAGDTATITYTPAKGTDASATAYNNGSFADDFKVMRGSTDVTASYNLTTKTEGKLTINKAAINPSVSIDGWTAGNAANAPTVTGNTDNGTVTIEYKKSTDADTAYAAAVPTTVGTYTVRATIDETANYLGATATAEFKISAKPVVVTDDDSDKKNDNEEGSSTNEETGYEAFMKELRAAAKKGSAQTLVLNWGNSLSYEAMQILKDNPQLTLIFNFKWQGVDYSTTIGGGRTVHADKTTPWYGPECLIGRYGATRGRVYVSGNTASNQGNGVYVVQRGDSLWKIANRKLHVSVDYLVQKNNIVNRNRIRTGQVIYY